MKIFKKLKTSKGMKILRAVEVIVIVAFTAYCLFTFMPQIKSLLESTKQEQSK